MKFFIEDKKIEKIDADIEIVFICQKSFEHRWVKAYREDLELLNYKGNEEEVAFLPHIRKIFVGINDLHHDSIRIAASKAIQKIKHSNAKCIKVASYNQESIGAIVEGIMLGIYEFDTYKSEKFNHKIEQIVLSNEDYDKGDINLQEAQKQINEALIVSQSVNFARDIINQAPHDIYPKTLAKEAKKVAKEVSIACKVLDEKDIVDEKMMAFYNVGKASVHESKLVHLTYKPKNAKAKIALIGKGLTYDSGGLSLKPGAHMTTMKADKSGSLTVLGIIRAASLLKLPVEIQAFMGCAENMVGGDAYKPDDILKAKNGKTIEIRNTDAEGRLVLADTLCYAQENMKPDYIFDFATLTGACVVGVGEYTTGVMGFNKELIDSVLEAFETSGEYGAYLPFNKYLKATIKSPIADICNISSTRYGGAITAGLFLSEFIEEKHKQKWVHFDIAGPAFIEKPWGYNPYGASGVAIRTLIAWLKTNFNDK